MWIKYKTIDNKIKCEILNKIMINNDQLFINNFGVKNEIKNEIILNDIYTSLQKDQKTFDLTIYQ